jgi:hypothetical protein
MYGIVSQDQNQEKMSKGRCAGSDAWKKMGILENSVLRFISVFENRAIGRWNVNI